MGNWAEPAYESSYSSFQTFCASWGANSGTFNGGIGPCPSAVTVPVSPLIVPACTDSPNWADNWGSSCQIYIDHGRCIDGAITTMQTREEMSGWATIAPYDACCACGRGVAPRVVPTTCVTCSGSTNVDGYWGTYTGLTKGFATYGPFTCMEGSDGLTFRAHGSCP